MPGKDYVYAVLPGASDEDPEASEVTLALRGHTFLTGLDEARFATLAKIAQLVQFREHELILAAKQRSPDFYLVVSGSVSIELDTRLYTVRIQSLGPGDAFGWSALLEHRDTLFDVRTRESSTALRLDGARLSAALQEDPVFAAELLRRTLHLMAMLKFSWLRWAREGHLCPVICGETFRTRTGGSAATVIGSVS